MFVAQITLASPPAALRIAPRKVAKAATRPAGFARGTMIRTIFGTRPVESLMAGDLVLDVQGQIVELRGLRRTCTFRDDLIQIDPSAMGLGLAPGDLSRPLVVAGGQSVAVRDWRTDVLFGGPSLTPARALVDGVHVRALPKHKQTMFTLEFDQSTVILANGLNVLVAPSNA